ncbi:hypothetical protein ACS0TY_020592 [Phlomoides rotata]
MAKTMPSAIICMLLVLTLFVQDFAGLSLSLSLGASTLEVHRQLLLEMKRNMALKNGVPKLAGNGNNEMELRRVPAGPDPLHHNGQDPKKPTTP